MSDSRKGERFWPIHLFPPHYLEMVPSQIRIAVYTLRLVLFAVINFDLDGIKCTITRKNHKKGSARRASTRLEPGTLRLN